MTTFVLVKVDERDPRYWLRDSGYTHNPRERAEYQTISEVMLRGWQMDMMLTTGHSVIVAIDADSRSSPRIVCASSIPQKYLKLIKDFVSKA